MLGEHTFEVLSELLGMTPDEVGDAAAAGALEVAPGKHRFRAQRPRRLGAVTRRREVAAAPRLARREDTAVDSR